MSEQFAHGKICYLILPSKDPGRSAAFYRDVFDWAIRTHDDGSVAFDDPTGAVSGMWVTDRTPADGGYEVDLMVDDVAATAAMIVEQGGTILGSRFTSRRAKPTPFSATRMGTGSGSTITARTRQHPDGRQG